MASSALLVALSLLAADAVAASSTCSSGSKGFVSGPTKFSEPFDLVVRQVTYKVPEICSPYKTLGMLVTACAEGRGPVSVVFNADRSVTITNYNSPAHAKVYSFSYCSGAARSEGNNMLSLSGGASPVDGPMGSSGMWPLNMDSPNMEMPFPSAPF